MKAKNLLLFIVVFCAGVAGGVLLPQANPYEPTSTLLPDKLFGWKFPITRLPLTGPRPTQLAYSNIRDPGGIPEGLPVRLKIPGIAVDSAIEDALITPDGRMDVPAGSVNVAWFSIGPHPGQVGSAVIGGHFGINNGVKFVFYDLDKLKIGDKVYIVDDRGDTLAFQVRSIRMFGRNDDATPVFTSGDGLAHLNLITCEGVWNRINGSYPSRRVVFTDQIPAEGAVAPITLPSGIGTTKAEDIAAFPRVFGIGAAGVDVAKLQTFLEQKGFLMIPPGIAKGFFGILTRSAVAKYQISAGLPSVGIFGPLTRAKVLAEMGGDTGLPNTGAEEVIISHTIENSPVLPSAPIQFLKSLFGSPADALITSLLLSAIFFVAFKIII